MSGALDLFAPGTIKIQTFGGLKDRDGWRYRDFHLHAVFKNWRVTHVPSGTKLPFDFPSIDQAAECAVEVIGLRTSWTGLTADDALSIREDACAICMRYGGTSPGSDDYIPSAIRSDLNGYAELQSA